MGWIMDCRFWSVLGWNIRGINAEAKQLKVREKMEESNCAILCLQETKKEAFDRKFIRGFCPRRFDNFVCSPSVGSSGGMLVVWNSAVFTGVLIDLQKFGIIIKFTSTHSNQQWTLVNIYGPCQGEERDNFVQWLYNLNVPDDEDWLFMGDFNFIRSQDNRNRPGGDLNDIFLFNEIISHLGLIELPLKGRSFTWSNMQNEPLLEQLDWFFTSVNWTDSYPNTMVHPLAKTTSDHVPCNVSIQTSIPKVHLFRFENFWPEQPGFLECVTTAWQQEYRATNAATLLVKKLKGLRSSLKKWKMSLSKLKDLIARCNMVILFFDSW
jgi:exonuclease III